MKKYSYNIPIYYGKLNVLVGENLTELAGKYKIHLSCDVNTWLAFVAIEYGVYSVLLRPSANPRVVAHESVHIVNAIFKDVYIKLDIDNDEPYAYMLGWVVEKIHNSLNKYNINNV